MTDKKELNEEKKALDEETLEGVSGGKTSLLESIRRSAAQGACVISEAAAISDTGEVKDARLVNEAAAAVFSEDK